MRKSKLLKVKLGCSVDRVHLDELLDLIKMSHRRVDLDLEGSDLQCIIRSSPRYAPILVK